MYNFTNRTTLNMANSVGFYSTSCDAHAWLLKGCGLCTVMSTPCTMNMVRKLPWFVNFSLQWSLLTGQGYQDVISSSVASRRFCFKYSRQTEIFTFELKVHIFGSYLCKGSFTCTVNTIKRSTIFLPLHVNSTMWLHWTHFQMVRKMVTLTVRVNKA